MIGGIQILQVHIKVGSGHFRQTADTFAACTTLILLNFFTDEDMTPIQDIAGLVFAFTLGLTFGLMLGYLIFRKNRNLVVQQRGNYPVEPEPAVPAPRRPNGRKQPTEHDERQALTFGLPCYLIFRNTSNLVVQGTPNRAVEQAAVTAPRRPNEIQRIGRKQPTEHDERLAWVSSETAAIQNCSVTCGLATLSTVVHLCEE